MIDGIIITVVGGLILTAILCVVRKCSRRNAPVKTEAAPAEPTPMGINTPEKNRLESELPKGWYSALVEPDLREMRLGQGYEDMMTVGPNNEQRRATHRGRALMKNRENNRPKE